MTISGRTLLIALVASLVGGTASAGTVLEGGIGYLIPDQADQNLSFSLDHLSGLPLSGPVDVNPHGPLAPGLAASVSASGVDLLVDTTGLTEGHWLLGLSVGGSHFASLDIAVTLPGDANLDGKVDVTDLGRVGAMFGQSGAWADGDFSGDGLVDVTDLAKVGQKFGQSVVLNDFSDGDPVAHAPLPGAMSAGLALLGLTAIGHWRRRRFTE
jgi:MYXO-CTERM domain-containing protein